jgi:hypothetical protein
MARLPDWHARLAALLAAAEARPFDARIPPAFARPGDVILAGDPSRLGVVVDGGRAAFVGPAA